MLSCREPLLGQELADVPNRVVVGDLRVVGGDATGFSDFVEAEIFIDAEQRDLTLPRREKLRSDSALPRFTKSSTDMDEPKRVMLNTDTLLPRRAKLRRLIVLPS